MGAKAVINMAVAAIEFIGGAVAEGRDEYRKIKAERMERPAAVVAVAEKEKAELAAEERVAARHKALCEEFFEIKP
jgi:hypothetical protein